MSLQQCHCCWHKSFHLCYKPLLVRTKKATTAMDLMRSRYTTYVLQNINYLINITHHYGGKPFKNRNFHWVRSNMLHKLEIIHFTENTNEFKAYHQDDH